MNSPEKIYYGGKTLRSGGDSVLLPLEKWCKAALGQVHGNATGALGAKFFFAPVPAVATLATVAAGAMLLSHEYSCARGLEYVWEHCL